MSSSKGPLIFFVVLFLVIAAVIYARNQSPSTNNQNNNNQANPQPAQNTGDEEIITLGLSGGSYTPNPIVVHAGKTVVLQKDASLVGCSQQIVQPQLGIHANFLSSNEYRFIPLQKGTFPFTCTMGMYRGVIQVI